ncbi:MAG: hypothetical protein AAF611_18990 [Bacteroidota bacterium]
MLKKLYIYGINKVIFPLKTLNLRKSVVKTQSQKTNIGLVNLLVFSGLLGFYLATTNRAFGFFLGFLISFCLILVSFLVDRYLFTKKQSAFQYPPLYEANQGFTENVVHESNPMYHAIIQINTKEDFLHFYKANFFVNLNQVDRFEVKDKTSAEYLVHYQNKVDSNAETIINNLISIENTIYVVFSNNEKVEKETLIMLSYAMSAIKNNWIKHKSIKIASLTALARILLNFFDELQDIDNLKN